MKKYYYRALKDTKDFVSGYIEAETQADARLRIKQMGFIPASVYEEQFVKNRNNMVLKSNKKVSLSLDDKISFTSELHNLLSSSISILDALVTIEKYSPRTKIVQIAHDICENIKSGANFSEALEVYSKTFGNVYIALCKAGEASGSLPQVLDYLVVLLNKQNVLKGKYIQMSIYPAILIVLMVSLYFLAGGVLFPRIITMMSVDPVPTIPAFFVDSVSFICNYWLFIIIAGAGSLFGVNLICPLQKLKDNFADFCLKIPALGNCIRYFSLAHYMSVLHICYESGIPIVETLDMAEGTIQNKTLREQAKNVVQLVRGGKSIAEAFEMSKLMPGILLPLMATGEKTGKLGQMFRDAAIGIEKKLDMALEILTKTFEPVLILVIGIFVAIFGIAIFQMYIQSISALAF